MTVFVVRVFVTLIVFVPVLALALAVYLRGVALLAYELTVSALFRQKRVVSGYDPEANVVQFVREAISSVWETQSKAPESPESNKIRFFDSLVAALFVYGPLFLVLLLRSFMFDGNQNSIELSSSQSDTVGAIETGSNLANNGVVDLGPDATFFPVSPQNKNDSQFSGWFTPRSGFGRRDDYRIQGSSVLLTVSVEKISVWFDDPRPFRPKEKATLLIRVCNITRPEHKLELDAIFIGSNGQKVDFGSLSTSKLFSRECEALTFSSSENILRSFREGVLTLKSDENDYLDVEF